MSGPAGRRLALVVVALGLGLLLLWWQRSAAPAERIVLVVIDTLRRDFVSGYDSRALTPQLDALARRGQRLDALASYHQTAASMAALFTGKMPSLESGDPGSSLPLVGSTWCGLARFHESPDAASLCLPGRLETLAERLHDAGYWTIGIASNSFLFEPSGFGRGFDDWVEVGRRRSGSGLFGARNPLPGIRERTWRHVHRAAVEALIRRPSDRFFLYVHYMDVHDYGVRAARPQDLPTAYAEAVAEVDAAVGRLLARLEDLGLLEDAVVIVTSDHGERIDERHALPGTAGHMGNPSFQEVLEIPLIVWPALAEGSSRPLRTQDLFGLMLDRAGLDAAADRELAPGELLISERLFRTYLDGRFKTLVRRSDGRALLFDLGEDPGERRDVASRHPDLIHRTQARIEELARGVATSLKPSPELSDGDRERLRALGYLPE